MIIESRHVPATNETPEHDLYINDDWEMTKENHSAFRAWYIGTSGNQDPTIQYTIDESTGYLHIQCFHGNADIDKALLHYENNRPEPLSGDEPWEHLKDWAHSSYVKANNREPSDDDVRKIALSIILGEIESETNEHGYSWLYDFMNEWVKRATS